MRFLRLLLLVLLITPLAAGAATSTLTLPEEPATEGETVEIEWQPTAGTYKVTAERVDESGMVLESETKTFVVKALP
ncbi:MAG: hypothetical protein U1C66_02370, partial [Patescibacteria group bacterium]|nr:hypothetical protein [Patescibacteria group bacterium]